VIERTGLPLSILAASADGKNSHRAYDFGVAVRPSVVRGLTDGVGAGTPLPLVIRSGELTNLRCTDISLDRAYPHIAVSAQVSKWHDTDQHLRRSNPVSFFGYF
jgi:hypothetical protein